MVKPLNDLLAYLLNNDGKNKPKWSWSPECQDAFSRVVKVLSSPPVLAYPDFELPFILNVDASQEGLGATLCQNQGGKERVIAYGSRGLRKAERNYSAHKLEFLCLKWAVTEKFSEYLYGRPFTVRTDNNPLTKEESRRGRSVCIDREVITALCKSQQLPVVETICSEESCLQEACRNMEQPCLTKNDIKANGRSLAEDVTVGRSDVHSSLDLPRRSRRTKRPPGWMTGGDFVCYRLSQVVSPQLVSGGKGVGLGSNPYILKG
ncbi:Retrovirus-related Pol polyprotein from transposon 412 [Exaiptasia diaphana]|nr:Retrovirus-related Pol polyprotein from transposon 412 [Exaiptasia diaphana]